jgi:NADH dehydrogenase
MLDVTPAAAVRIAGDRLPPHIARALARYRHGPAAFKVEFAVQDGVPWSYEPARRAGTLHLGGTFEEIAYKERQVARGEMPDQPFVLVCQQYLADPTRSNADVHPVYSYAHVPNGWRGDATGLIEQEIERHAPGFRDRILARYVRSASDMAAYNANYVGGDILGGANSPQQLLLRPRPAADPYSLGIPGVYICSAATPPGAGAHGMSGYNAAVSALRHVQPGVRRSIRLAAPRPLDTAATRSLGRPTRHRVVIVGSGFGGLAAARGLARAPVELTVIDRRNFHLFQPLLYQVATGSLSPGEIASPLRGVLKRQENTRVVMAEVVGFNLDERRVILGSLPNKEHGVEVPYDSLILAAGARHSFFGNDRFETFAPGMKTIEDALRIRRRMLMAFEAAELEDDPDKRRAWLNFVVVGAGPTGVEVAGQIAEIANYTLRRDFRAIDPRDTRVMLVEAADRVLPPYVPQLSAKAQRSLERLGVIPLLGTLVTDMDWETVTVKTPDGRLETIPARTKVWAAGVEASPLARALAAAIGAEVDRAGRITVNPDLTLPGHAEVFAIGDMNRVANGAGGVQAWPGVAQTAIQEGRYAAAVIGDRLEGSPPAAPFDYHDKGSLATIGRWHAVADLKGVRFAGAPAWLAWLLIHLFALVGFENRMIVFARWTLSVLGRGRGQRLMTGESVAADYENVPAARRCGRS